jgi:homoserine dehydrogenase
VLTLDLVLIGFGHVGRRFVQLLAERERVLAEEHGTACRVAGIATLRHGTALFPEGLNAARAASLVDIAAAGVPLLALRDAPALIETAADRGATDDAALVVVETTTLDIRRGQPAIDHVRTSLERGAHVITANKGPAAFAFRELRDLAERKGLEFRFESAVMDGVPVFNLVNDTLPGVQVDGFRGVINSTTNYMLCEMEKGREWSDTLSDMQSQGIAEADPSLDVEGWDAATKTAALANVLFDAKITPHEVRRRGITGIGPGELAHARRQGRRLRLVARATRSEGRSDCVVAPVELPEDDPLALLPGMANALILETELLGPVAITELGGGLTPTAYGLFSDLVAVSRRIRGRSAIAARRSP